MQRITSRDNPKVKNAAGLIKSKNRKDEGLFLIEGKKLVEEALQCDIKLVRLFFDEAKLPSMEEFLKEDYGIERYVLTSQVFRFISDTQTPQGVIAVARKPEYSVKTIADTGEFLILLDHISDPGNLGGMIRTAWALGVGGILLTRGCVDPFNPKVVRASMGGIFHVPVACDIEARDLIDLKQHQGFTILGTELHADRDLFDCVFTGRQVVVIGSESQGISGEIKGICDSLFKIPMEAGVDSLNAAIACGIIACEAYRQRRAVPCYEKSFML